MAAPSLALNRHLLSRFLRPVRAVAPLTSAASRCFTTNAVPAYDTDDCDFNGDRRSDPRVLYMFDPFSARSQAPEMMHQPINSPASSTIRQKQTAEGLHLQLDMPGLGKDEVKVSVEQNTLIVKGETKNESDDIIETGRSYSSRITLPNEKLYKTKAIKAEMKNGVLQVFVPKLRYEERTDVFHVSVE